MCKGLRAADHHDLQERVEHCADCHGRENRARQNLFFSDCAPSPGELDRLLEPLQSEHDARRLVAANTP